MRQTLSRLLPLLLLLLLCGCTVSAQTTEPVPAAPLPAAAAESPVPAPTEAPDPGLAGVELLVPEDLRLLAETPETEFTVRFAGVDPDWAAGERICTLQLLQDGRTVWTDNGFVLTPEARASMKIRYDFVRYTPAVSELTLRLCYRGERLERTVPVELVNYSDEVYSAGLDDPRPYAIDVIRNQNLVTVYGRDDNGDYTMPVKVFLCSTGPKTPVGTYDLGTKKEWALLFGGVWGQYGQVITGNILFHSVPYTRKSKDSLETEEYNKLGTAASMGCVRLAVADVKWIFDYCPWGTDVRIYDADETLYERPESVRLDPDDPRSCWDPTDPDEKNPWKRPSAGGGQQILGNRS